MCWSVTVKALRRLTCLIILNKKDFKDFNSGNELFQIHMVELVRNINIQMWRPPMSVFAVCHHVTKYAVVCIAFQCAFKMGKWRSMREEDQGLGLSARQFTQGTVATAATPLPVSLCIFYHFFFQILLKIWSTQTSRRDCGRHLLLLAYCQIEAAKEIVMKLRFTFSGTIYSIQLDYFGCLILTFLVFFKCWCLSVNIVLSLLFNKKKKHPTSWWIKCFHV